MLHSTHELIVKNSLIAPETNPIIADVEITTDDEGRFNLNALHKASGHIKKNGPSYWLALDSTKELINELVKNSDTEISVSPVNILKGGLNQGTFAHELLAISYAGWISPSFQLKVNQVFLDFKTGKLSTIMPTRKQLAMMVIEVEEENERLVLANTKLLNKVDNLENLFREGMTPTQFCKILNGVNVMKINNYLAESKGWLYKKDDNWRVSGKTRDKYLTEKHENILVKDIVRVVYSPILLKKGASILYQYYIDGKLPMKKSWNGLYTKDKF